VKLQAAITRAKIAEEKCLQMEELLSKQLRYRCFFISLCAEQKAQLTLAFVCL